MKKAWIYTLIGSVAGFIINYFFYNSENIGLDIFYALSFGVAWGMAYFLDDSKFSLPKKFLISFGGMGVLVLVGSLIFDFKLAFPSILKFSTVFVAYYMIASLRSSKSMRS